MLTRSAPLKVAVLCSRRAPGLTWLLNRDENRGRLYDIVCCLSSEETFAEEVRVERRGIPCIPHPIRAFCRVRGRSIRDAEARIAYDEATRARLAPFHPDVLILSSYLYILGEPMLREYPGRMFNVHYSDLAIRTDTGEPRYPGLRSVRDAMAAGEREIRASLHIVTEKLDAGPVLLRSWPFPVPTRVDDLAGSAFAQQQWMFRAAAGPLLARGLALAADGKLMRSGGRVLIDGMPAPFDLRATADDAAAILFESRGALVES